jgi:hypothetical protein
MLGMVFSVLGENDDVINEKAHERCGVANTIFSFSSLFLSHAI